MDFRIILLIFSAFIGSSVAQEASCLYINATINNIPSYMCYLTLQNPNGLEIESIGGEHLAGMTNADVNVVWSYEGVTTNVPSRICAQFPNIVQLDLSGFGITTIAENALGGCSRLNWMRFWLNRIQTLPAGLFANNTLLEYLDFDNNQLQELPETIFAGLVNLQMLELRNNPFNDTLPGSIFSGLTGLEILYLQNARIRAINPQWFQDLPNLVTVSFYFNLLTEIPEDTFAGAPQLQILELSSNPLEGNLPGGLFRPLTQLSALYISNCEIIDINPAWFWTLGNLRTLMMYWNRIRMLSADVFSPLVNLTTIDIGGNYLNHEIPGGIFRNQPNLLVLYMDDNVIGSLNPQWIQNQTQLLTFLIDFNLIEDIPAGFFANANAIVTVSFWANNLKTLNRNIFGNLQNLQVMDMDNNVINAVDRRIIDDAVNLFILYFWNNQCASGTFFDFVTNRVQHNERLATCYRNFEFIVDTSTEADADFAFYPGPHPGIAVRVTGSNNIQIALTPFDFPWNPMLEVLIGAVNNTQSMIRRNGEEVVVRVPSPNVLRQEQWNGFRITWANRVILVFREGDQFPFMGYTMEDVYPVNFYGLRTSFNRATWSIQPIDMPGGINPTV